jgi:hypothetical protein
MYLFSLLVLMSFNTIIIVIILSLDIDISIKLGTLFVGICSLYVFTNKNTYFPFVGPTFFLPASEDLSSLQSTKIKVQTMDGTRIYYWTVAEIDVNPIDHYTKILKTGETSVQDEEAEIYYKENDVYVQYRMLVPGQGMLSSVLTQKLF